LKTREILCLAAIAAGMALIVIATGTSVFSSFLSNTIFAEDESDGYVLMEDGNGTERLPLYSGMKAHVEYITTQSSLAGKEIDTIQLRLAKKGSPAGLAAVGVFDRNLAPVKLFGSIDAQSIETKYRDYSFSLGSSDKGYVLRPGDGVGILYGGGDGDNRLAIAVDPAGPFDGKKTFHRSYRQDENRWVSQLGADLDMKLTSRHAPAAQPAAKYVMIHFDDGTKSQYNYAYPVLERYGLKGTFWIVCDYASSTRDGYMNWAEIDRLAASGHDIQNHGMTHVRLSTLTDEQIAAQVRDCKEMVMQHGSTGDAFAIPFNEGDDDPRIVGVISKVHAYGKGSGGAPQRADCGGNCEITNADGTYNENNRYTMEQWSHDSYSRNGTMTEKEVLDGFVKVANLGGIDMDGNIVKIPIIMYHRINEGGTSPSASLFAAEMKYLRDNGFRTIGMDDITYDAQAGKLKLRQQ
jgi:hypothetical protein